MLTLMTHVKTFMGARLGQLRDDERGVTTVEYAIMLVLVAIAVAASTPGIKDAVINTFSTMANTLNTGLSNASSS